jgi:hypothetical protein
MLDGHQTSTILLLLLFTFLCTAPIVHYIQIPVHH